MCLQVSSNKRYAAAGDLGFTVSDVARNVEKDFGKIDVLVHSLANGPEVTKPLLTSSEASIPAMSCHRVLVLIILRSSGCGDTLQLLTLTT